MLRAGYIENWVYGRTQSGTPQGGVCSPILANVYLDKLDRFVEQELVPAYTKGTNRHESKEYRYTRNQIRRARDTGDRKLVRQLVQTCRQFPSHDPDDPTFRRLRYVRYADDFLLGFIGPKSEAEEIKRQVREFLHEQLKLELSQEKTLVTHARTATARFLNYEITVQYRDDLLTNKKRWTNGTVALRLPKDVLETHIGKYQVASRPKKNMLLAEESDFTVVARYGSILNGLYNYYSWAQNVCWLLRLKYAMENSLLHTLAFKHHTTVTRILKHLKMQVDTPSGPRNCLEVKVTREGKTPLIARFGGFPIVRQEIPITRDATPYEGPRVERTERIQRLLHEECEYCGDKGPVEGHHVRKLADLKRYGRTPPPWVQLMAMRHRKTLYVCHDCHVAITHGRMNLAASLPV